MASRRKSAAILVVLSLYLAPSCMAPTEITLAITTDIPCSSLTDITVTVAPALGEQLESSPPVTTSNHCANGDLGTLVIVPGEAAVVGIKVVAGTNKRAEDCKGVGTPPVYGLGCVIARRALAYIPHTVLRLPIVMRAACDGVTCATDQTCVEGACASAAIDSRRCTGGGCPETDLDAGAADADADADAGPAYHAFGTPSLWSKFDATTLDAKAAGFFGATFDGKYVYFAPYDAAGYSGGKWDGLVVRYDTSQAFTSLTSWATFDTTTVSAGAKGFGGAIFDGPYVYLMPYQRPQPSGLLTRYDTSAPFGSASSWTTYDLGSLNQPATGLAGATRVGSAIYLAPALSSQGVAVRYDTTAFGQASSYQTFSMTSASSTAHGFAGASTDGRYVYYTPYGSGPASSGTLFARYDSTAPFTSAGSWAFFDVTTTDASATGFIGAAFDGKYMYFAPYGDAQKGPTSHVVRFDTTAAFTTASSWQTFDTTTASAGAKGFQGAVFDGRYVYFVPFDSGLGAAGLDGLVARYDTQSPFASTTSWETFDMTTVDASARGFAGAAFDGEFVYFVPSNAGVVIRFDARSPPAMPPYTGSFF